MYKKQMQIEKLFTVGFIILAIGVIIIMLATILGISGNKTSIKGGAVGFLGPIPLFGFASDKKTIYLLFAIGIIIFIVFTLLRKFI